MCGGLTKHRFMEVKCWNMGHHDFLPSHFVWTEKTSPQTGCEWISPVTNWGKIHLGNRLSLATMAGSPNPLGLIRVCVDLYV